MFSSGEHVARLIDCEKYRLAAFRSGAADGKSEPRSLRHLLQGSRVPCSGRTQALSDRLHPPRQAPSYPTGSGRDWDELKTPRTEQGSNRDSQWKLKRAADRSQSPILGDSS